MPQNRYTGSYGNRNRSDDGWRGSERSNASRYSANEDRGYESASRGYRDEDGSSRAARAWQSGGRGDRARHDQGRDSASRYDEDRYGEDVSRSRLESRRRAEEQGYDDDRSRYGGRNDWIHGSRYRNDGYQEGYGDDWEDTNRPDRSRATRYASEGSGRRAGRDRDRLHDSMPDDRRWGTRGRAPRDFYDPLD